MQSRLGERASIAPHRFWPAAALSLGLLCLCILVQQSSVLYSALVKTNVSFQKIGNYAWQADLTTLSPGAYYLSIGRPRGLCDLSFDGAIAATTKSAVPELRGSLLFGASFTVGTTHSPRLASISCVPERGFNTSLTHPPIVAPYRTGVLLQIWRAATELLLGPFASILLLGSVGLSWLYEREANERRSAPRWPLVAYGVCALAYSCSLAYYPRLFLGGLAASMLHVVLRSLLAASFLVLANCYARQSRGLIVLNAAMAVLAIGVGVYLPTSLDRFYDWAFLVFPLSTLIAVWVLFRTEMRSEGGILMRYIALVWLGAQLLDFGLIWLNVGAYTAPSVTAMLAILMVAMARRDEVRHKRIERTVARILAVVDSKRPVEETLAKLAELAHGETSFSRISAYVDGFTIGAVDTPKNTFVRVIYEGYRKDVRADHSVVFTEGRGLKMRQALQEKTLVLRKGEHDGAYFINVPVGDHACLNLSNDRPRAAFLAYESLEVMEHLLPALKSLSERLIEYGVRSGFAMERLRSLHGDGVWDKEIGAVFVDVNDYSKHTERYGDVYARFIADTYLPALCRAVRCWAVREFSRGDEIYFVCVSELIQDQSTVPNAVAKSIAAIAAFTRVQGAQLAAAAGFEPVVLSVGANYGSAAVISDAMQVRTAGEVVIEASRLREAAPRGGLLLHGRLADVCTESSLEILADEVPVLVKKNLILARRAIVRDLAS